MIWLLASLIALLPARGWAFATPQPPPAVLTNLNVRSAEDVLKLTSSQKAPVPAEDEVIETVGKDFDAAGVPSDDDVYGWYSGRLLEYDPAEKRYKTHAVLAYGGVFAPKGPKKRPAVFKFLYVSTRDGPPSFWDHMTEDDKKKMEDGFPALAEKFPEPDKSKVEVILNKSDEHVAIRLLGTERLIMRIRRPTGYNPNRQGGMIYDPNSSYVILAPNWKHPNP